MPSPALTAAVPFRTYTLVLALLLAASGTVRAAPLGGPSGHEAPGEDKRTSIPLDARERNFLLGEMRHFLVTTQRIVSAVAAGDFSAAAAASRSAGLAAHRDDFRDPASPVQGIRRKAPTAFFPLGQGTHQGFDDLAQLAEDFPDKDTVLGSLGDNLRRCTACHAQYRIGEAP